ncbi:helix-turn-helix domain-containing protein [Alkalibacillus haloalkaliphilus]|uniref:helix-turn-helix domain-containing protein n=1 Tax=Alkalibacillus haloalkaliphilus TaxID=94136 RepID=UPI00293541BB|nr:helix-turn-helix transcriptional regulator [Alkalibacillus haloalkaliphilus]MDV2581674.1 helix-turn-helix transcriptional regulator [Alkalibacillus haloalkaliphilus]
MVTEDNKLGQLIKRERMDKGWSLAELAAEMGNSVDRSYLWRIEKGEKKNPSLSIILKLIRTLDIDLAEFLALYGMEGILSSVKVINESDFTFEDLYRNHKLNWSNQNQLNEKKIKHQIDQTEKEHLIAINNKIYSAAFKGEHDYELTSIISEIESLVDKIKQKYNFEVSVEVGKSIFNISIDQILIDQMINESIDRNRILYYFKAALAEGKVGEGLSEAMIENKLIITYKNNEKIRLIGFKP